MSLDIISDRIKLHNKLNQNYGCLSYNNFKGKEYDVLYLKSRV